MKLGFWVFGAGIGGSLVWAVYEFGSPELDGEGNVIEDEFSKLSPMPQYFGRMWKSLTYYQKMIQEPSREKLLPDPVKYPYIQPKYTLVLEMKDVLVHPDWTYQTGWRFKKRPGVDTFLEQLAGTFEIVVYTADQGMTVFPILDALDPNGFIMYRLVRDATHFVDGHHVKNLDNLNRDLSKVIVIDWDANSTKMHPDNTFNVARWQGNDDDSSLLEIMSFLKSKWRVVRDLFVIFNLRTFNCSYCSGRRGGRARGAELLSEVRESVGAIPGQSTEVVRANAGKGNRRQVKAGGACEKVDAKFLIQVVQCCLEYINETMN